jgi:hypothetical protein
VKIQGKPWMRGNFVDKGISEQTICAEIDISLHPEEFCHEGFEIRI